MVQEKQQELTLNGTQLLAYADDVYLLGDNMDTIKRNMETLIDDSMKVCLEINVKKTKSMLLSTCQKAWKNFNKSKKQIRSKCSNIWQRQ
jgi:predicted nucleotide-binding protein (sugar kinase/HSP70/actin superfamily)